MATKTINPVLQFIQAQVRAEVRAYGAILQRDVMVKIAEGVVARWMDAQSEDVDPAPIVKNARAALAWIRTEYCQ